MVAELVSNQKKGSPDILCADNHINKTNFIPVQFVTAKGKLHYVRRTEGTDGTGYYVPPPMTQKHTEDQISKEIWHQVYIKEWRYQKASYTNAKGQ